MEKKNLRKCAMYIGIEVIPRLFCPALSFSPVLTQCQYFWEKFNPKLQVSEKVTNSGGLMLVCGLAGVNVQVQIKFRSTICWASIYLLKVSDGSTRWISEICWKLTINTPEWFYWRRSGVFTVNVKHISHPALVFLVFLLFNR